MQELWKEIKGYNGRYLISNFGQVKNKDGRLLIGDKNNCGYRRVCLSNPHKRFFIHRLVAYYFCNPPINYSTLVVNHIDGNKLNCRYCSENDKHAFKNGLRKVHKNHYKTTWCPIIIYSDKDRNNVIREFDERKQFADYYDKSYLSVDGIIKRGYFIYKNKKFYVSTYRKTIKHIY